MITPGQTTTCTPASPDALSLQAQLAALAENDPRELRPLLEFFRALLQAGAVAALPAAENAEFAACVVTTRGVSAASLPPLVAGLDFHKAAALPAPVLGPDVWTLAVPVRRENAPLCWLLAQLAIPQPRDVPAFLVLLQTCAGYLLYREQRGAMHELGWLLERTSRLLDIFRRTGAESDFEKACRMGVDELRDNLGCARVLFGVKRRGAVHVRAISGVGRLDLKSSAHPPFEAAMAEAIAQKTRLDFPAGEMKRGGAIAHEILLQHIAAAHLTTLPLPRENGALLLEWKDAPTPAQARLVDACAPFAPVLFDLLERARPNALVFSAQRAWSQAGANRRAAFLTSAAVAVALLACPFHYSITADCRLAPTVKRVIAAPFQGQLHKSFVQPGEHVAEGQLLAELDNRDLKIKEAELTATRDRAIKQRDKAMSNDGTGADPAAAQVANFEAQSIGQELELVQRKIALLAVKAPLAGVVVVGDLRRSEGQPLQQGQVLFEIAPLEEMIVEIDVPDREVSRLQPGQPVRVRLESFAGEAWATTLDKVHPQSEQRDGRNVFIAEAAIVQKGAHELRPGMRGRAVLETARRPLAWILGHRLWEFVVESLFW